MKQFARLITELDQTTKTHAKVEAMVRFLALVNEEDKVWMMALLSHRKPKRGIKTALLRDWVVEYAGLPDWLVEESYQVVGDLSETLALLLPRPTESREDHSLAFWMTQLQRLSALTEEDQKAFMLEAWRSLEANERLIVHKLITGGFRLGVSQKLLVRALAKSTGLEENAIAHRLTGKWTGDSTTFQDLLFSEDEADQLSRPYPLYLAHPIDQDPSDLGEISEWQAEWKWDGIRVQLIKRSGEFFLWSRGEELITEKFPELNGLAESLPDGTVIDGELLPFKDGHPLPFQLLQGRINRKTLSKKQAREAPCLLMAYDLLEEGGQDLREAPLIDRRQKLETIVALMDLPDALRLSESVQVASWQDVIAARENAREHFAEGVMLKRKNSTYQEGRTQEDWWKWKVDPLTVDAVMIYAQRSQGRKDIPYSEYTFALWGEEGTLVPFAKVSPGLTGAEMKLVNAWIKQNTVERFGPVRSVKAELVFEIGFDEVNYSRRHKSGVIVRAPGMLRWRQDKKASEADQLVFLKGLIQE